MGTDPPGGQGGAECVPAKSVVLPDDRQAEPIHFWSNTASDHKHIAGPGAPYTSYSYRAIVPTKGQDRRALRPVTTIIVIDQRHVTPGASADRIHIAGTRTPHSIE